MTVKPDTISNKGKKRCSYFLSRNFYTEWKYLISVAGTNIYSRFQGTLKLLGMLFFLKKI